MKYTVEAINGKEVTVVFENGQRAKPVIAPGLTPEEIDIEVGRFDSTYRQVGVPTKAVQIGEIRTTIDPKSTVPSNHSEPAAIYDPYIVDLGQAPNYIDSLTLYMLAQKEADAGNEELLNLINARVAEIQSDPDYSYADLLSATKNRG